MTQVLDNSKWLLEKYGPVDELKLAQLDHSELLRKVAQAQSKDVLIRVLTTTATYTDQIVCHGFYYPSPALPLTPGYDLIGVIESVGGNVPSGLFSVGDRCAAMPQNGCMATHILLPHTSVVKVSAAGESPSRQVAAIRTGVTAYQMLHRCCKSRVQKPESVKMLIHSATGATGGFLLSVALAAGVPPQNIHGTCSAKNLPLLIALGVHAYDYAEKKWSAAIKAAGGVDLVFDAVVLGGYYEDGLSCLSRGGKYVAYGFTDRDNPGVFSIWGLAWFFTKMSVRHLFSWFDGIEAEFYVIATRREAQPREFEEDLQAVLGLVAAGKVPAATAKVWSFSECRDALLSIAQGKSVGLQVVKVSE